MISYVYVDGESHFVRSENFVRKRRGDSKLELSHAIKQKRADEKLLINQAAKVFWSSDFWPGAQRTYYFSSMVGGEDLIAKARLELREHLVDPYIFAERKSLRERRENTLSQHSLIEKPKQVDAELVVKLLLDAMKNLFDECHIFTSDIDILPAIKAVREMGKRVFVYGFEDGISKDESLKIWVDRFHNLEESILGYLDQGTE